MKLATILACFAVATVSVTPSLFAQGISQDTLPDNHLLFTLQGVDAGFEGTNEYLPGFTVSMTLPRGTRQAALNVPALIEAIRRDEVAGVLTYPTGATTPIVYEVVRHRAADDIYMKTTLGYFLWESAIVSDDEVSFVIDFWYTPPVRLADVDAVAMTERLVADSTHWHKRDDRQCEDDRVNDRWSLFCALKHASVEIWGEYNHHNAAMNTVRSIIADLVPQPPYEHPLMDYNNADSTTHADILHLLAGAKERLTRAIEEGGEEMPPSPRSELPGSPVP